MNDDDQTAENDAGVSCNWSRCNSSRTGKCFAWCQCRCHDARARRSWAEKHYTEPCESCGARVGEPCRTASGYVTTRHASRRKTRPIPPAKGNQPHTAENDAPVLCCGAEPPYSVTHIDPAVVGGDIDRWFVMGTVDGDPRDQCGPVAICEYEPSAHVIAALLNTSGGCVLPPEGGHDA